MAKAPKPDTLKELGIKFYQTRSEKTFTDLYHRIKPGLFNYVYQILKDTDLTNQVVSMVMTNAYNKIDTYNTDWHISTWIYRIAYNTACMELRYKKAECTTPMSYFEKSENKNWVSKIEFDSLDTYKDCLIKSEEEIEEKVNNIRLRKIISELPKEYQQVIEEKFFNDLKYEEISQKLEIPLHTVKNRISRAKKLIEQKYV